jgi:hypothetical protein
MSIFARWRAIEEARYSLESSDLPRFQEELTSLAEILELPCKGLKTEELYKTIRNELRYKNPKFLAAKFASICKDRSNLGQSSFFRLVAAGRGFLEAVEKIQWLCSHFKKEPEEFASFLLFGRAPWTEKRLSKRYRTSFTWARNFLVGARNKFTHTLKNAQMVVPKLSYPPKAELLQIAQVFIGEIQKKLDERKKNGADVTRIKSFLNSLLKIKNNPTILLGWNASQGLRLTWKALKTYAKGFRGISFSAFRALIIRACLRQEEWKHAIERCIRLFTPENTLRRPFHERVSLYPLPIDLLMGSRYVVCRPGNAKKMRELIKKDRCIWFEIPKVFINDILEKVRVCWYAPKKVIHALEKGAKINLFRFNAPKGPGKAIKVDLTLSGNEEVFIGGAHLNAHSQELLGSLERTEFVSKPVLGLDVNRLSEHVVTASVDLGLKAVLQERLDAWHALEHIIANLQRKLEKSRNWQSALKLETEIKLLHKRRSNLRNDVLTRVRVHLGKKLVDLRVDYVGLEGHLHKDTKDKRSALAKAISSMPDNVSLVAHELVVLNTRLNKNIKLVLVRKEGTSRFHHGCGGILKRVGDCGACKKCGAIVNTHENSADNIEERTTDLINQFKTHQLSGGTPSTGNTRGRNRRVNQAVQMSKYV